MRLKVTISVGNYSNITLESNEFNNISECAKELARDLSRIEGDYYIDSYIESYLIPLLFDKPDLSKFKKENTKERMKTQENLKLFMGVEPI